MQESITLNKLKLNTYAEVTGINCNEIDKRRFLDLGIIKGTKIRPVFKSPLGDPTAYEIRKTIIALREEDTEKIEVLENFTDWLVTPLYFIILGYRIIKKVKFTTSNNEKYN